MVLIQPTLTSSPLSSCKQDSPLPGPIGLPGRGKEKACGTQLLLPCDLGMSLVVPAQVARGQGQQEGNGSPRLASVLSWGLNHGDCVCVVQAKDLEESADLFL